MKEVENSHQMLLKNDFKSIRETLKTQWSKK
jgi:hypothetical protein